MHGETITLPTTLSLVFLITLAATPARAQDVMNKDAAAAVKASFLADIETLRSKFVGLAEAFPRACDRSPRF